MSTLSLIKELADRAGIDFRHIEKYADDNFSTNLQKFAELVMAECASACSSATCGREESAEDLINQHFEVTK